jgi:hypothetical protein
MQYVQEGQCDAYYKLDDTSNNMTIKIRINENVSLNKVFFIAAAPAESRSSYTGSGLPFASPPQAFDNTPNQGQVALNTSHQGQIRIKLPNAYYAGLGTYYVPPTLYLKYNNGYMEKLISVKLSDGIPYRMLTYPIRGTMPRKDVTFYQGMWELPVRTQEQILRDAAYPDVNKMHPNFWGLKPPV